MNDLPPGYIVKADMAVGYSYYDEQGDIIFQHPKDNESARLMVWQIYNGRKKKGK